MYSPISLNTTRSSAFLCSDADDSLEGASTEYLVVDHKAEQAQTDYNLPVVLSTQGQNATNALGSPGLCIIKK